MNSSSRIDNIVDIVSSRDLHCDVFALMKRSLNSNSI